MLSIQETPSINLKKLGNLIRVYSITMEDGYIKEYLNKISNISIKDMEYIPYLRFLAAREFEHIFKIKDILLKILSDPNTGAFLIDFNHFNISEEMQITLSTAISHLLGVPSIDPLSGKYYASFTVKHTDAQLPNLLRPYETFKMHTDGAYMKKVSDWIFFMKLEEKEAAGGQTRLLHINDWNDFDYFHIHPINKTMLKFFSSPDSNVSTARYDYNEESNSVYSSILNVDNNYKSIRFIDRFIHPKNLEEAEFVYELQKSLENSKNIGNKYTRWLYIST
ncbi:MAG: carbon starvation induced protein CsiD [Gammaproteobacteria bacterium]